MPSILGREVPFPMGNDYALVRTGPAAEPTTARVVAEPLASRRFRLRIGGAHSERTIDVGPGPVTIGRASTNTVQLGDPDVSGRHLVVEPAGAFVRIVDAGSRNGTFLDGARIESIELGRRARLRLGRTDVLLEPCGEGDSGWVVRSAAMAEVVDRVDRAAPLPYSVLLLGETGVGKEGLAARLHAASRRATRPFVAVDIASIPTELVGAELFGYERGAFTGAVRSHRGAFEQADEGTIFLDEVGELSLDVQARLLRVIETLEVRRLGAERGRKLDVRIVAATHRPLASMVAEGRFRSDLYYRIAQLPIAVPPLRERRDDILPIARSLLCGFAGSIGPRELDRDAEAALRARSYPGNVRDLRNLLLRAAMHTSVTTITPEDLIACEDVAEVAPADVVVGEFHGNVAAAARALGIPRTTLRDRLRRTLSE